MDNIVRTFNVNVKYHSQLEKVGIDWSTDKFNRRYTISGKTTTDVQIGVRPFSRRWSDVVHHQQHKASLLTGLVDAGRMYSDGPRSTVALQCHCHYYYCYCCCCSRAACWYFV